MAQKRLGYVDIAKAFAIIFIIIGHYGRSADPALAGSVLPLLPDIGYSFHVPLFFIVSGLFIKSDKPYQLKREAKNLLLPYAASCLLIVLINMIQTWIAQGPEAGLSDAGYWLGNAFYGAGSMGADPLWPTGAIGGLWFLLALFWSKLFLWSSSRLPCPALWIIALFILGISTAEYVWLPFSIQSGLCTTLYLYVGQLITKHELFERAKVPLPVWALMLLTWVFVVFLIPYPGCYPVTNNYPHGVYGSLDILGAVSASFIVVRLSQLIENHVAAISRFLQWLGRNTMALFCMHVVDLDCVYAGIVQTEIQNFTHLPMWAITLPFHFAFVFVAAGILYILPRFISSIWFPQKKLAQQQA